MKINYKNIIYITIGLVLVTGSCFLGYKAKEDFDQKKKEVTELQGFENLAIINEEPAKEFKPKKVSKLNVQCNSNSKSCHLY
jgi:hypothetical protein